MGRFSKGIRSGTVANKAYVDWIVQSLYGTISACFPRGFVNGSRSSQAVSLGHSSCGRDETLHDGIMFGLLGCRCLMKLKEGMQLSCICMSGSAYSGLHDQT